MSHALLGLATSIMTAKLMSPCASALPAPQIAMLRSILAPAPGHLRWIRYSPRPAARQLIRALWWLISIVTEHWISRQPRWVDQAVRRRPTLPCSSAMEMARSALQWWFLWRLPFRQVPSRLRPALWLETLLETPRPI